MTLDRRTLLRAALGGTVAGMASDVLAQVVALPGVEEACDRARSALDGLLWDRGVRKVAADLARASALRGAWANAAMDGAEVPFAAVESGTFEASPMGERAARTVALTAELPRLVEIYDRTPLQALARMNTVLVGGLAPDSEVGRPRADSDAEDPLRIGRMPLALEVSARLSDLAELIVAPSTAPALVKAGIVHGELAVLRPFRHASGPVARASIRLSLAAPGLDPDLLTVPESGLLSAGRNSYVKALRGYSAGTADGVADWLTWFCSAVAAGAQQSRRMAAELG